MYVLKYHKATSIADAVAVLGDAEDGKVIAGGQTLVPTMKQHLAAPSDLIDIRALAELQGVCIKGDALVVGAATRHADVALHTDVQTHIPALATLAGGIGDPAVRAMGTIGGSLANNDPSACYPAAALALNATIITDRREVDADAFFAGMFATDLDEDEIITSVRFPIPEKAAYAKFPNPASRYAMVGVFVAVLDGDARVAVTGAGEDGVFRHQVLEAALAARFTPAAVDGVDVSEEELMSDLHGSAAYRAQLIKVMAKRAVIAAG